MTLTSQNTAMSPHPNGKDLQEIHAPDRISLRSQWAAHSEAAFPELFPWDLGLPWKEARELYDQGKEKSAREMLSQSLISARMLRLDLRYTITPTRAQAFQLMEKIGLTVIPHCLTCQIPEDWEEVVIYLNEYGGHLGQDKIKVSREEAIKSPGLLCSRYLAADPEDWMPSGTVGLSRRDYVAGNWSIEGKLASQDWRSNVRSTDGSEPEGYWRVAVSIPEANWRVLGPYYAVDYVRHQGKDYAMDFNITPGIKGDSLTGLKEGSLLDAVIEWKGWQSLLGKHQGETEKNSENP